MPKMTYGIMTFHRNHRIESPAIEKELSIEKPNACVACHLDKTDQWISQRSAEQWGGEATGEKHGMIQSLVELHAGDPVQRGLAAFQMGQHFESLSAERRMFMIPHLLLALTDSYPAIRRFAHKALLSIIEQSSQDQVAYDDLLKLKAVLTPFDFIADQAIRVETEQLALNWFNQTDFSAWPIPPVGSMINPNYSLMIELIQPLREEAMSSDKAIDIGE
jgi:hypothetical protein